MVFGGEKCIIGYSIYKCIYCTLLHIPAGAVQDGLGLGTLDDVLFIGHVINTGLGGVRFCH